MNTKKKVLFIFIFLIASLFIFNNAKADSANNCHCANGSAVPFYYPEVGSATNLPSDDACNQECANRGSKYYSYSNLANAGFTKVTKLPKLPANNSNDNCDGKKCNSATEECKKGDDNKYVCSPKGSSNSTDPTTANNPGNSGSAEFENPLEFKTVQEFLNNGLSTLRSIIVVLSIIFIVLGGIMYIVSAGNDDMMKKAKGAIGASLLGLAIGIAAPSFLKEIYSILGAKDSSGVEGPSMTTIAMNFLNFLLSIVGILALIMLIIGGIMYLTSAGDEDRIKSAKKIVTYSIIGIAVSLASLVIVKQIAVLLK